MASQSSSLARIWQLVKLEKREIGSIYFYAILSALIQLTLPVGVQAIIGFVLGGSISSSLILLITLVVLGVMAAGLMQISQMRLIEKIQQQIFVRYAFDIADKLPRYDMKKADGYYLPELVNRFFDTATLQKGLSKLLLDIPAASIQILSGILLLAFYHPAFILFGIFIVTISIIILYYTGNRGLQTSIEESNYKYAVAAWLEEMARMIRSFKFSGGSQIHLRKTDQNVTGYLTARTKHFKILVVQYRVLVIFKVVITAVMLGVGSVLLVQEELNIGQFIAAEIVILTIINSVEKLIGNLDSVYDVLTSVDKLAKITEKPLETDGSYALPALSAGVSVELQNISFGYNDGINILKQVSFKAGAGEKVAVTGRGGSGKSTLLRLLTGAYNDFEGAVLVDNIPVGNFNLTSLRSQTGIALSHADIFQGTLWENITMGNSAIDMNTVQQLAGQTGLNGFIEKLNKGFDTVLDPAGHRLSRSVIQKILITRALVQRPRLLLLEEPWEGLEENHVIQLQELLLKGLPDTTVIVATNDAAFAGRCTMTVQLHKGVATVIVNSKTD